ncbi:RNA polymerase sigma factor [Pseudoxanthomonas composti]|uniref:RNA polymerase sigma factor n=1 Tax=Pseudoxanthomonas composti TaxID=2137479 RepID=A0A4Q1JU94_9GAMM|nr:RNA polymerase sigma factor [Pseudoxanthomonas composti]RXR05271.1 RNA polymerase sigma factor [Pseudoxanthomonas composti]
MTATALLPDARQDLDAALHLDLSAAAGGDGLAYGRVVATCQNTVTAIALAITRDVQASEDIAQEAFLRAWQQLSRLHNHASFLPWLRQITRNLARDWLRSQRGRPMTGEVAEIAIGMAADPAPEPAQRLVALEEERAATEIISSLPEDSRETLLLFYREGQSSQQVAQLLGISDAAVRKRLSRAREAVREELLQRFGRFARGSAPSTAFTATLVGVLGLAAKPAAAAGVEAAAVSVGGGLLGKWLVGSAAAGAGALAGGLLSGGLTAWLMRGVLFRFTETQAERRMVWRAYCRYLAIGIGCVLVGTLVALTTTSAWALAATLVAGIGIVTCEQLGPLRRVMQPLIARDTARDRQGARRRQMAYRLSFGMTGTVLSNFALVVMVLPLILQRL